MTKYENPETKRSETDNTGSKFTVKSSIESKERKQRGSPETGPEIREPGNN